MYRPPLAGSSRTVNISSKITYVAHGTSNHHLVPVMVESEMQRYFPTSNTRQAQNIFSHIRWMLLKDLLGQDMFLLSSPSGFTCRLVRYFCALANRELEMLTITSDTSEMDLKERREISAQTISFVEQPPVLAARHGRILFLDGVHKAERNVLPTLNNLLENREMNLQSGRRLVHSDNVAAWSVGDGMVIPCHRNFRVVAHGAPVPKFPGFPLDPPFRSRFQCRLIEPFTVESDASLTYLIEKFPTLPRELSARLAEKLQSLPRPSPHLLETPVGNKTPHSSANSSTSADNQSSPISSDTSPCAPFDATHRAGEYSQFLLHGIEKRRPLAPELSFSQDSSNWTTKLQHITEEVMICSYPSQYIAKHCTVPQDPATRQDLTVVPLSTDSQRLGTLITFSLQHQHHVCVIGPKCSGKSHLIQSVLESALFNSSTTPQCEKAPKTHSRYLVFPVFKEMTATELICRRSMNSQGVSRWEDSLIVRAAKCGVPIVLDGIHRCSMGSFGILSSLLLNSTLQLPSGERLISFAAWERLVENELRQRQRGELMQNSQRSDAEKHVTETLKVHPMRPGFIVIAVGETADPSRQTSSDYHHSNPWITTEIMSLFSFFTFEPYRWTRVVPDDVDQKLEKEAIQCFHHLEHAIQLTPRTVQRILSRLRILNKPSNTTVIAHYQQDPSHFLRFFENQLLIPFLPPTLKANILKYLPKFSTEVEAESGVPESLEQLISKARSVLRRGTEAAHLKSFVTNFLHIPNQELVMRMILQELVYSSERCFLLIGNQGTGKNKLCDALLSLLDVEREYMQLHRDSTVQSLTLSPSVVGGQMRWEPSPLMNAIEFGRCVVIDEADKASLEVVCALKTLLCDGILTLPDGRTILRHDRASRQGMDHTSVHCTMIHPNFACFVLANRPGFPFLGNDFFKECGDAFSCHIVENPDSQSELALLRSYAPHVPQTLLEKLSRGFQKLRSLVDSGELTYPFSARELVNVVKHLESFFPHTESVVAALRNVFEFDAYSPLTMDVIRRQLEACGIVLNGGLLTDTAESVEFQWSTIPETAMGTGSGFVTPIVAPPQCPLMPKSLARVLSDFKWFASDEPEQSSRVLSSSSVPIFSFPLQTRNISHEISGRSFRKIPLALYVNPRSYHFSELLLEAQISSFATQRATGSRMRVLGMSSVPHHGLKADDASCHIVLCNDPNTLYLLTSNNLSYHASPTDPSSTGSSSNSTATNVCYEVETTFCSGRLEDIFPLSPLHPVVVSSPSTHGSNLDVHHAVLLVSLEAAALFILFPNAYDAAKSHLIRISIPRAIYSGEGLSASTWPNQRHYQPQTLGGRTLYTSDFLVYSFDAASSSFYILNTKINLLLRLRGFETIVDGYYARSLASSPEAEAVVSPFNAEGTLWDLQNGISTHIPIRAMQNFSSDQTQGKAMHHLGLFGGMDGSLCRPVASLSIASSSNIMNVHSWKEDHFLPIQTLAEEGNGEESNEQTMAARALKTAPFSVKSLIQQRAKDINRSPNDLSLQTAQQSKEPSNAMRLISLWLSQHAAIILSFTVGDADPDTFQHEMGISTLVVHRTNDTNDSASFEQQCRFASVPLWQASKHLPLSVPRVRVLSTFSKTAKGSDSKGFPISHFVLSVLWDEETFVASQGTSSTAEMNNVEGNNGKKTPMKQADATPTTEIRESLFLVDVACNRIRRMRRSAPSSSLRSLITTYSSRSLNDGREMPVIYFAPHTIPQPTATFHNTTGTSRTRPIVVFDQIIRGDLLDHVFPSTNTLPQTTTTGAVAAYWDSGLGVLTLVAHDGFVEMWELDEERLEHSRKIWSSEHGGLDPTDELNRSMLGSSITINEAADPSSQSPNRQSIPLLPSNAIGAGGTGTGSGSGQGSGSGGGGSGGGGGGGGSGTGANLRSVGTGRYTKGTDGQLVPSGQMVARRRTATASSPSNPALKDEPYYLKLMENVAPEIQRVVAVLEAVEAKEKERVWLSHKVQGELDERKLVEGVLGESNVFRQRGIPPKQFGIPQKKPKFVDFVVDVSASMARFNAWDGRLDRMCEALVLVLEAAKNFQHKFIIEVHGHSGSADRAVILEMTPHDQPEKGSQPSGKGKKNIANSQLPAWTKVVDAVTSHARTAVSGDGTLEALRLAIAHAKKVDADERLVILISDANLGGYGVMPSDLKKLFDDTAKTANNTNDQQYHGLPGSSPVRTFLVFLAEAEASEWFIRELPVGTAFHCSNTKALPGILREIFISAVES